VSASGDASNRLIAAGDVAEIDTSLIPGFQDVIPSLQSPPHNTVDQKHYGVPYLWGPNVLMYNTEVVKLAPKSWSVTWESDSPYAGKVTATTVQSSLPTRPCTSRHTIPIWVSPTPTS
jgi:putative spermidine/putrescine transport system substrate-binding protein